MASCTDGTAGRNVCRSRLFTGNNTRTGNIPTVSTWLKVAPFSSTENIVYFECRRVPTARLSEFSFFPPPAVIVKLKMKIASSVSALKHVNPGCGVHPAGEGAGIAMYALQRDTRSAFQSQLRRGDIVRPGGSRASRCHGNGVSNKRRHFRGLADSVPVGVAITVGYRRVSSVTTSTPHGAEQNNSPGGCTGVPRRVDGTGPAAAVSGVDIKPNLLHGNFPSICHITPGLVIV
ncbi:hypothetical protein Bbelb_225010 [Branchiostoma belcheri]|nr:hypothetical protein Bbelb_225010 [Branchiostoma belcheri]